MLIWVQASVKEMKPFDPFEILGVDHTGAGMLVCVCVGGGACVHACAYVCMPVCLCPWCVCVCMCVVCVHVPGRGRAFAVS